MGIVLLDDFGAWNSNSLFLQFIKACDCGCWFCSYVSGKKVNGLVIFPHNSTYVNIIHSPHVFLIEYSGYVLFYYSVFFRQFAVSQSVYSYYYLLCSTICFFRSDVKYNEKKIIRRLVTTRHQCFRYLSFSPKNKAVFSSNKIPFSSNQRSFRNPL